MLVTRGMGFERMTWLALGQGPRNRPEWTPMVLLVLVLEVWMAADFRTQFVAVVLVELESQVKPRQV